MVARTPHLTTAAPGFTNCLMAIYREYRYIATCLDGIVPQHLLNQTRCHPLAILNGLVPSWNTAPPSSLGQNLRRFENEKENVSVKKSEETYSFPTSGGRLAFSQAASFHLLR